MTPGWPATWWGNGVWSSRVSGRSIVSMDTLETDCVGMLLEREGAMLLRNAHCVRFVYAVPRCAGRRHSSGRAKPLPSFIVTAFGPRGGGSHRYIPPHSALCCVSSIRLRHPNVEMALSNPWAKQADRPITTSPAGSRRRRIFISYAPDWVITILLWVCFSPSLPCAC